MTGLIEDNEKIHDLALQALHAMLVKFGPSYRFPTDAIWEFIPDGLQIKSTQKPHQPRRLVKEGYLQETGVQTKAQSGPRAGSPTTEYRFGPRLVPTDTSGSIPPKMAHLSFPGAMRTQSYSDLIRGLQEAMEADGYVISTGELTNFVLAMTVSPLVILSGISGTGKSLLPRKFAKFTKSLFFSISVQPQWSDNSDLFGYVPSLASGTYVSGKIIEPMLSAKRSPEDLVLVLLDEMNLAPVEHYFSDFLSVAESRERVNSRIVSARLPIDLPSVPDSKFSSICMELNEFELPNNLRVIGTANMDESTHSFSPKVLDRAFVVEFDDPDLTIFANLSDDGEEYFEILAKAIANPNNAINIKEARNQSQDIFEQVALWLNEIQGILAPAGVKFGYRTRDAILLYLHFWRIFGFSNVLAGCAALDFCILQKILPKISGSGEALEASLKNLSQWLESRSELDNKNASQVEIEFSGRLERSREKVERMILLLDSEDVTRYWGT